MGLSACWRPPGTGSCTCQDSVPWNVTGFPLLSETTGISSFPLLVPGTWPWAEGSRSTLLLYVKFEGRKYNNSTRF